MFMYCKTNIFIKPDVDVGKVTGCFYFGNNYISF